MKRIRMILMIAGILKGDECLLRNTSGNVKIANLLKTIPEIILNEFAIEGMKTIMVLIKDFIK